MSNKCENFVFCVPDGELRQSFSPSTSNSRPQLYFRINHKIMSSLRLRLALELEDLD